MGRVKNDVPCVECLKWEGLWCPCCGRLLRTKPRAKSKNKIVLSRVR